MNQERGHKRKISFADLRRTIGPMAGQQQQTHGPPPPAHLTAQQMQQQQLEAVRRNEHAKRQSKKPTDRELPDELADVIVGDGAERYKKLRETERRLDAVMMRKRLDVSENVQRRASKKEGVMRIWISNTAEGQPWQVIEEGGVGLGEDGTFDFGESSQATYRVKIEGRLLEDPEGEKGGGDAEEGKAKRQKLSHFFKLIKIDFDRNPALQPDGFSSIQWEKPRPGSQGYDANGSDVSFDTLEFERKSDENINVTINLVRDDQKERFKLSPLLAEILDTEEEDRAGAVQGIWEYCRAMGLQDDDDKRSIVCDDLLRKVSKPPRSHALSNIRKLTCPPHQLFQKETVYFPYVPDMLVPHLQPLPPVQLAYTIRVDKTYLTGPPPSSPTIYDLLVPLPTPHLAKPPTSKTHLTDLQTLVRTDEDLALLAQKIHQTNAKRKFYDNLAKDPATFVRRWMSSQGRDLEVVMAEAGRGGGEDAAGEGFRRGGGDGVWGSGLARESVGLWLARNSKAY